MALVLDYVALETRRTLRDTGFVIFGIGMPVLMYLLFTNIGGGADSEWKTASMIGMATYGALGAALSAGTGVAEDKSLGWLRQLRITPMTPAQVVVGRALTASVVVLPAILAVLAVGGLINGVSMAVWQWAVVVLLLWFGSLPFTLLGIGNGYRLSAQSTGVVNVGCNLGFSILGGLWFPMQFFPGWIQGIGTYTPTRAVSELGTALGRGEAPGVLAVVVLLGWLLIFGSYAVVSYRKAARTA
ncbi:ABC transporter [Streptomyces spiroverticillatus]|uniref:ABC transporter n=1 Tax=Streptomyces finlayi TaxID=67296 RepID=A0A919CCW7_9ACTN|nr:ABC transporter permease [Streptomyces finlayi]GGZ94518.1 ABC transporter [Streptomyces spiroverticillatus]GHD06910.1 ABC transporter [Streptomyces finlayi]